MAKTGSTKSVGISSMRSSARRVPYLAISVLALLSPLCAHASNEYDQWLRTAEAELRDLVTHQFNFVSSRGPTSIQSALRVTEVDVRSTGSPSPFVTVASSGRSRITMPAEFLLLAKFIGDSAVVGFSAQEFSACATSYTEKLRDRLAENSRRSASGRPLLRLPPPEEHAASVGPSCRAFGKRFPISQHERGIRDQGVRSVAMFALLHELGHVALGHRPIDPSILREDLSADRKMRIFLEAMRESRGLELSADLWAADTLAAIGGGYSDVVNTVIVNYFLTFTGLDCLFEAGDTHPNGVKRYARIVDRFKLTNESVTGKHWPADVASLAGDLQTFSNKAATLLGCPAS